MPPAWRIQRPHTRHLEAAPPNGPWPARPERPPQPAGLEGLDFAMEHHHDSRAILVGGIPTIVVNILLIIVNILLLSSTLHCRGKNGRSKKIGQTNQKMIHFVPNMYVSGKISALQPGTQTVMIFGTTKKSENYLKQRDFRICVFLRVFACFCGFFAGFFAGFCGFYPQSFDALQTFFGLCLTKPKNMQSKS